MRTPGSSAVQIGRRPILPGARKQRDVVVRRSCASALIDLMDVLADTGPGAQGGTVIDHYPHTRLSLPYPYHILAGQWVGGYILCVKVADLTYHVRPSPESSRMKIAVVGTGYVGLVLGACLAENGNDVICIDKDEAKVRQLRRGVMPIYEPGLEEMVRRNRAEKRLEFTKDLPRAVRAASIVFIAVGTPQHEDGSADLTHVLGVAREIAQGDERLQGHRGQEHGAGRHRRHASASVIRRETTHPFSVVSNPEFLKQGAAVEDFLKPDRVVIGVEDERAPSS